MTDELPLRSAGRRPSIRGLFGFVLAAILLVLGPASVSRAEADSRSVSVIVREATPASVAGELLVRELGGTVTGELPIVGGFSARLPASALPVLRDSPAVRRVWRDEPIRMAGLLGDPDDDDPDDGEPDDDDLDDDDDLSLAGYDKLPANTEWRKAIRLNEVHSYEGEDVTVAVLDTGVGRIADLGGRVLARVDLTPDRDGYDRFGHGTHIAGVIAGDGTASDGRWTGVAPDVDLVSVKVAGWDGATDVSVVLAGLQWIVANQDRYDIRVLNLSFGTDSTQSYLQDPLNYAIERVWASGILVVSSAGNRGPSPGTVSKPGDDPFVLTVGAADVGQTAATNDDAVAEFSARGPTHDGLAKPDLVAPGVTIVSTRAVGSTIDVFRPAARVRRGYFKGTGTSQAAAIVSGIAALMFEASPALTPDVAKAALMGTATRSIAAQAGAGAGLVDAAAAVDAAASGAYVGAPANGALAASSGLGSLDASRGSLRVYADLDGDGSPEPVSGETDVLGKPWNPSAWWTGPWSAPLWGGKHWGGMAWEGKHWGSSSWSVAGWNGKHWGGKHWGVESWK